jgi:Mg2+ and Co2+ transporter CorA
MSFIKFASELHAEPEAIGEPVEKTPRHGEKQSTRRFSINFEALEKVLVPQDDGQDDCQDGDELVDCDELRRKNFFPSSTTFANQPRPQRITLYSPSFESTFQATCFRDLGIENTELPSIFSEHSEHLWWLDVQNPSEKELRLLCSGFHIHPLTVEDILAREVQEKIEDFTHYYFASFRSYRIDDTTSEKTYKPYTIYMVVFRTGTLSFCFNDSEHANHVLARIELLEDYVFINSDWIFYAFVYVLPICFHILKLTVAAVMTL